MGYTMRIFVFLFFFFFYKRECFDDRNLGVKNSSFLEVVRGKEGGRIKSLPLLSRDN